MNARQQYTTLAGRADFTCVSTAPLQNAVESEERTGHIVVAAAEPSPALCMQKRGCTPYVLRTEHHAPCTPRGGGKLIT